MFYVDDSPNSLGKCLVSLKTGRRYAFRGIPEGEDFVRAARELERDDTPAPEPEPGPVQVPHPQPRPIETGSHLRMQIDEMKLQQLRKK